MTDDELLQVVSSRIDGAASIDQGEAEKALDYYLCRPRGDELPGRSAVVSADVADMVHATLAQMLPSFTGDQVCEFEPDGEGDEEQARLESDAVNRVLMESSRGYVVLAQAITNALQLGQAVCKVWVEDEDREEANYYREPTPEQRLELGRRGALLEDRGDGSVRASRRYRQRRVRLAPVDPLNFRVHPDHDSPLLEGCPSCHERKVTTRQELLDMGIARERVEQLSPYAGGTMASGTLRYPGGIRPEVDPAGWATEMVEHWESYLLVDDGDGAVLTRVLSGDRVLLDREPAGAVCYASGTAIIQPHRWRGLSLYDLLRQVQDVKTATLRAFIDNLRASRTAANMDAVNIDDLMTERPKGVVRVRGPVVGNISDLNVPDLGASAQSLLSYMDRVRSERGGAALEMASGEPGLVSSQIGAANVQDVLTSTELLGAMFARNVAETLVRSLFMLVHRVLRTELLEPLTLRRADTWVTVNPGDWNPRDRVNIKVGLSPGERRRRSAALQGVLQYQMGLMQAGLDGVLVTMPNLYACVRDWCAAQSLDAGDRYFTNPTGEASKQAVVGKVQGQQQQAAQAAQLQQATFMLEQMDRQLKARDQALQEWQARAEIAFKYWEASLNAEIEEARLVGAITGDLARQQEQGRAVAADTGRSGGADPGGGSGGGTAAG